MIAVALASEVVNFRFGGTGQGTETRPANAIAAHETLQLLEKDSGNVSFQLPNGKWLSLQADGSFGERDSSDGQWEEFTPIGGDRYQEQTGPGIPGKETLIREPVVLAVIPLEDGEDGDIDPPIPPTPGPITLPDLRIVGKDWKNGDHLFVPRFVDMLTALRISCTVARWRVYADWAGTTGFNGVRVFAGHLTWATSFEGPQPVLEPRSRRLQPYHWLDVVTPQQRDALGPRQTPDEALRRLPDYLDTMAEYGLVTEVTAITDSATGYDWRAHLRRVAEIVRPRNRHVILECANEIGHGSQAADLTVENIAAVMREVGEGILWAPGAAVGTDEANPTYPGYVDGCRYVTAHLDRGRDFWNQARRVRELYGITEVHGVPCLNNEPLGAAESPEPGRRESDPAFFATLGSLDRSFRGVGGVHHSAAGLMVELPPSVQQECAEAYVTAQIAVDDILRQQPAAYYNSGHQNSPVGTYRPSVFETRLVRHYAFVAGPHSASDVIGVDPALPLNWANGWHPVLMRAHWHRDADNRDLQIWELTQ